MHLHIFGGGIPSFAYQAGGGLRGRGGFPLNHSHPDRINCDGEIQSSTLWEVKEQQKKRVKGGGGASNQRPPNQRAGNSNKNGGLFFLLPI